MVNAILSALLSLVIPGLGQAYSGDIKKGILFFIIFAALCFGSMHLKAYVAHAVTRQFIFLIGLIPQVFRLYAAFDAFLMWGSAV